jgi:hypothetical protein
LSILRVVEYTNLMKYYSLFQYNNEYLGKVGAPKPYVYFNPDNSVAVFEEGDKDLYDYILERAEKLKNSHFFMNPENEATLRDFLINNPKEEVKEASEEIPQEIDYGRLASQLAKNEDFLKLIYPKPIEPLTATLGSRPTFEEEQFKGWAEELSAKPSAAKIASVLQEIISALQK